MTTKEVACVRCRKVVSWHFIHNGEAYCADCDYLFLVINWAKSLHPEQRAELIAALQKGE